MLNLRLNILSPVLPSRISETKYKVGQNTKCFIILLIDCIHEHLQVCSGLNLDINVDSMLGGGAKKLVVLNPK